jgi:hypothetical protein
MRIHASLAASAACDAFDLRLPMPLITACGIHFVSAVSGVRQRTNWFVARRASPELMT